MLIVFVMFRSCFSSDGILIWINMNLSKVCGPWVVNLLDWTSIFEWHMTTLVIKNRNPKDTCHNEIGLCAQELWIIVSLIVNMIGRTIHPCDHLQSSRTFTLSSYNIDIFALVQRVEMTIFVIRNCKLDGTTYSFTWGFCTRPIHILKHGTYFWASLSSLYILKTRF